MVQIQNPSDEQLAAERANYLTGLIWHLGTFLIINAFFWVLDLVIGQEGIQWAFWITIFWSVGLAFHVLAWFIDGRQVERRRAQRYLEDSR
ncbi:MAG: 2TM domain-containing protein [Acidimicrobiales bacterium]